MTPYTERTRDVLVTCKLRTDTGRACINCKYRGKTCDRIKQLYHVERPSELEDDMQ